jgi:rare lipoprotein A (peptidoglycan hydrolase)
MIDKNPGRHRSAIHEPIQYTGWRRWCFACRTGMPNEKERRRMPLRQTIGISLALLMASTGALASTPEKSSSYHPAPPPDAAPGKSPNRSGKIRFSQKRVQPRSSGRLLPHHAARLGRRHSGTYDAAAVNNSFSDPQWDPTHGTGGPPQIGQAAWYDLVGYRTSSGERLDTVTPTAAHRSLPLGSCAKVTDLDTGHSIIVKINDRGPFDRRFIIDLSPRAAQELGIRHAGVAAVAVEPMASSDAADATEAVYRRATVDATQ